MKRVGIGALRHRVTLEQPLRAGDGGGGAHVTWSALAQLWASVSPASGSEAVIAEAVSGRISHVITLRFRTDITPAMRLRLGPRVFEILAVIDVDERNRELRCLCREDFL